MAFAAVGAGLRVAIIRLLRERHVATGLARELAEARAAAATAQVLFVSATDATGRGVRQLEVVQRAAARMTGRPSVRAVAEAIIEETRAIIDYDDCRVYLIEGDELAAVTAAGRHGGYETIPSRATPRPCRRRASPAGSPQHATALLIPDANADPRGVQIPGTDDFDESMVVVPMRYEDRVVGVILVARRGIGHVRRVRQAPDDDHRRPRRDRRRIPPAS